MRCSLNSVANRSLGIQVTADRVTRQEGTCLLLLALWLEVKLSLSLWLSWYLPVFVRSHCLHGHGVPRMYSPGISSRLAYTTIFLDRTFQRDNVIMAFKEHAANKYSYSCQKSQRKLLVSNWDRWHGNPCLSSSVLTQLLWSFETASLPHCGLCPSFHFQNEPLFTNTHPPLRIYLADLQFWTSALGIHACQAGALLLSLIFSTSCKNLFFLKKSPKSSSIDIPQ